MMKKLHTLLIIGFILVSPLMLMAEGGTSVNPGSGTAVGPSAGLPNPLGGNVTSIQGFVEAVLNNVILPVGSVVVVIMIIYAGFLFVTARGNETQIETAKHVLLYVVIGTAILLGSVVISAAIKNTLCDIAPSLRGCPGRL